LADLLRTMAARGESHRPWVGCPGVGASGMLTDNALTHTDAVVGREGRGMKRSVFAAAVALRSARRLRYTEATYPSSLQAAMVSPNWGFCSILAVGGPRQNTVVGRSYAI